MIDYHQSFGEFSRVRLDWLAVQYIYSLHHAARWLARRLVMIEFLCFLMCYVTVFRCRLREHWPGACILSDHFPQTIDTLHWAHKEPHTPGQGNKESFETLQQGKCATPGHLEVTFADCRHRCSLLGRREWVVCVFVKAPKILPT